MDTKCLCFERLLVQRAMKLLLNFSVFSHMSCVFRNHSVSSSAVENIQNSDVNVESLNLTFVLICIVSFENIMGETSFMTPEQPVKFQKLLPFKQINPFKHHFSIRFKVSPDRF